MKAEAAQLPRANAGRSPAAGRGAAESRRLILDTAARLFREEGYSSVSVRDIAAACQMKAGSLYYHFSSKDEIVADVLRIGVEQVYDAVRKAIDGLDAAAPAQLVIGTAVLTHLRVLLKLQDYTCANIRIFGQVPKQIRDRHMGLRDEYEAFWASLLNRCGAKRNSRGSARDLHLARFFIIGALNSSLEWYRPEGASVEHIAREFTQLILSGLQPGGGR